MHTSILVGNDIVDLHHPRCRSKLDEPRFLDRVLIPAEKQAVLASSDPYRALWVHWAAKEAAFKVAAKIWDDAIVLTHARFMVRLHGELTACAPGCRCVQRHEASVVHRDTALPVQITLTHAWVHAVAVGPAGDPQARDHIVEGVAAVSPAERETWSSQEALARAFSASELRSIHHPEAAIVRIRARAAMSHRLGISPERLRIVRGSGGANAAPPCVEVDGQVSAIDLSLSHHGDYVAWAFRTGSDR
ncbi:MAG: 4'-phosphopantetheinyl transferase superfamily protein [Gemmatimonadetes bacterium]|nr:4'-phosphopantetheinyl transferase superfamily protein [Gemmatimonadota bacterium]